MKITKGFTLVELIIVISIVAVLSTIGISTYSSIQQNSRNVKRKSDLKEMKTALEQVYISSGSYPSSGGTWLGTCSSYGSRTDTGATGYIPNLSPSFMAKLPRDPRESKAGICGAGSEGFSCYLYYSTGTDYKILTHCTPEGVMDPNDAFYDPTRPTWSWQVSSSATSLTW